MDKVVKWLREEQDKLQREFKKRICKLKSNVYEFRGVWISITCRCGYQYSTPHFIQDNGKCPQCGKKFYRSKK